MTNNNIVQIAHRIKYGDIIAKFQETVTRTFVQE